MNVQLIASRLNDAEGWKPLFRGLFGGGKVKKSFAVYSESTKKNVYPLHKLRHAEHEDSKYAVYAFCPDGEIAPDVLAMLTARIADISLGTIRYECTSYSFLQLWRGEVGSKADEDTEISGIAPEHPEILVFPVADDVNCTYVIYAQKAGAHYIYPITQKQAENIIG